jgi:hypothetical protein
VSRLSRVHWWNGRRGDSSTRWLAQVERVVLNALANGTAALPPDVRAFWWVHLPSSSGESDPP